MGYRKVNDDTPEKLAERLSSHISEVSANVVYCVKPDALLVDLSVSEFSEDRDTILFFGAREDFTAACDMMGGAAKAYDRIKYHIATALQQEKDREDNRKDMEKLKAHVAEHGLKNLNSVFES
ncbi:hypothetical protein GGF41_001005 [Coemansia sp. RSA 2531]|nr:hypothetical protein GGF41_001005 [Coemansia sp. RSA 2531]